MASHDAVIDWTHGEGSDADFLAGHYSRGHTIGFDGGVTLAGSASPSVVKKPWSIDAAADPEELLVAATSTCHMLWFLDFAKHAGFAVRAYSDDPKGVMGKMEDGSIGVTRIYLNPKVTFGGGGSPTSQVLAALHRQAHGACNIANSIRSEVIVEPSEPGPI